MNWLKENWFKVIITSLALIILTFSFYWFEYRTVRIKKECSTQALYQGKGRHLFDTLKENYSQNVYDNYYYRCLRERGL